MQNCRAQRKKQTHATQCGVESRQRGRVQTHAAIGLVHGHSGSAAPRRVLRWQPAGSGCTCRNPATLHLSTVCRPGGGAPPDRLLIKIDPCSTSFCRVTVIGNYKTCISASSAYQRNKSSPSETSVTPLCISNS
eukprot:6181536-Pleurochrysis_carterae.AAC.4